MKRALSITLDGELVARVEQLAEPHENRSAVIERLLRSAIETALMDQYARGYAEHPHTAEEEATFDAFQRLSAQAL